MTNKKMMVAKIEEYIAKDQGITNVSIGHKYIKAMFCGSLSKWTIEDFYFAIGGTI